MADEIADEEWEALASESFDPAKLLRAVDAIDRMRGHLGNGENGEPTELHPDLLRLHQLTMDVFDRGACSRVNAIAEAAVDLDGQVRVSDYCQPSSPYRSGVILTTWKDRLT